MKSDDQLQAGGAIASKDLLAFVVATDYSECSVLVFATTRNKAKSSAHGSDWLCNEEWIDLHVKRAPLADKYASQFGEGYLSCENADEQRVLRELGWYQVDHSIDECCKCGLHEWSDVPESHLSESGDIGDMICDGCRKANAELWNGERPKPSTDKSNEQ